MSELACIDDLIESVDLLTEEELEEYKSEGPGAWPQVSRMRSIHHRMAQMLAAGRRPVEISRVLKVSTAHISVLEESPAFRELLEHYRLRMEQREFDRGDDLGLYIEHVAEMALERVHERLVSDSIDAVPFDKLAKATEGLLDRAGQSPVKRVDKRSVHIGLTGEDLKEIRHEAGRAKIRPRVVETTGRRLDLGSKKGQETEAEAGSGGEGQGAGLRATDDQATGDDESEDRGQALAEPVAGVRG